ncbi:MAG: hypothetical protein WAW85_16825 [Gordonia sp. (in: high G+C Gram-positive bacteria)]|uniref:hypothetical protein n=1 Tax=Gordonia sp. (in: high G+C Gram-positive bacteria) TaxID=84139 RepID=UPI003BB6E133
MTNVVDRRDSIERSAPALILDTDSAAAPSAAGTKEPKKAVEPKREKTHKPPLSERDRALLENQHRGGGWRGLWARLQLNADNNRRERVRLQESESDEIHFDSPQLELTETGFVGPGGGRVSTIRRVPEFRGSTAQVPGLFPFTIGANSSVIGTPVGIHQETGQQVGYDCMSWHKAGWLSAPSDFILALNGYGKSTLVRRMVFGDVAHGVTPIMLGDIRPDYSDQVRLLGGQVIDLGFGYGKINPLSVGSLGSVLSRLPGSARAAAELEIQSRQMQITAALLEMIRREPVKDFEETLITAGLRVLGDRPPHVGPPLLEDLLQVLTDGPEDMVRASGAIEGRGEPFGPRATEQYYDLTLRLRQTLTAIIDGPFGSIFNAQSSEPLDITSGRPICIDLSRVPEGNEVLRAAALMTCWSEGFAAIKSAHLLADEGLEPKRLFHAIMDELARVLATGGGIVDRVDELTRIQRGIGTGTTMISHTLKDLAAFDSIADRNKALGFFERARAKIIGPVPPDEIPLLRGYIAVNDRTARQVNSWSSSANPHDDPVAPELAPGQDPRRNPVERQRQIPHGTGKFVLFAGESGENSAIPFHVEVTSTERKTGVHNTNRRFDVEEQRA